MGLGKECRAVVLFGVLSACGGRAEFVPDGLANVPSGGAKASGGAAGISGALGSAGNGEQAFGGFGGQLEAGGGPVAAAGAPAAAGSGPAPDTIGPALPWAPPSTNMSPSEASTVALDATHDNLQPNDAIATPLTKHWSASFSGEISYPLVAGGLVFVTAQGGQPAVSAFDVEKGIPVWGPVAVGSAVNAAYDSGRLYLLEMSGTLSALDAPSGKRLWSVQLTDQSFFDAPPVAAGGNVYINGSGVGGNTIAVDGATGKVLWSENTFDGSEGGVAVFGASVFEAEACDQISDFDAKSGARVWFHSTSCTGGGGTTPSIYGTWVWVRDWATANVIIDTNGNVQGTFAANVAPAFHGSTAFYTNAQTLTAVDITTSVQTWQFLGDGKLSTSAVVAGRGNQVFIASSAGTVFEVAEDTGKQVSSDVAGTQISQAPNVFTSGEGSMLALAQNHLFVPAGTILVVY